MTTSEHLNFFETWNFCYLMLNFSSFSVPVHFIFNSGDITRYSNEYIHIPSKSA